MSAPFTDKWELNGTEILLQDEGRDKANGVPILDENAKLPLKYITPAYSENLKVSPNDPYNMTFLDWAKTISSEAFRNPGRGWSKSPSSLSSEEVPVYANSIWVSAGGSTHWSEDGIHWTHMSLPESSTVVEFSAPAYVNGLWFISSSILTGSIGGGVWYSVNGKSWTKCTGLPSTITYATQPVYDNGIWLFPCSTNRTMYWSEDGKSWASCSGISDANNTRPVYANGVWLYSNLTQIYVSIDGKSWTQQATIALQSLMYTGSIWLAKGVNLTPGKGIWWSDDNGVTWHPSSGLDDRYSVVRIVQGAGVYVCSVNSVSSSSYGLYWSVDGKSWTGGLGDYTQEPSENIVFEAGVFIACSYSHVLRSLDGKNWTSVLAQACTNVVYLGAVWLLCDSGEGVWCSTDSTNWIFGSGGISTVAIQRIAYGDAVWVATMRIGHDFWYSGGKAWLPA